MATLPKVTRNIRTSLKVGGVFSVFLLASILTLKLVQFIKEKYYPPPAPPIAQKFGMLPRVSFPPQLPTQLKFSVNTVSGTLPVFPDRIKVYKIKQKEQKLLDLLNARALLAAIHFTKKERQVFDTLYEWHHRSMENTFIRYDILSRNFSFHSDYMKDPLVVETPSLPNDMNIYKKTVFDFLARLGIDGSDIDPDKTLFTYLKLVKNNLVQTKDIKDAQLVRVDLFQKPVNEKPIFYQSLTRSNMYFLLGSSGTTLPKIVEAYFTHLVPDEVDFAEYPLKPSHLAYQDLVQGKAYIMNFGRLNQIEITDVSFGYYIGSDEQTYLMPVVVFDGRGFKAFVHAIPDTSISQ